MELLRSVYGRWRAAPATRLGSFPCLPASDVVCRQMDPEAGGRGKAEAACRAPQAIHHKPNGGDPCGIASVWSRGRTHEAPVFCKLAAPALVKREASHAEVCQGSISTTSGS
mmetsp:Transcript_54526/g.125133  ORF Transcript_54526/g.125133 Transcript_54526/m.125133 type:complete len:112 (+) Transcript_54526:2957-3292(+)